MISNIIRGFPSACVGKEPPSTQEKQGMWIQYLDQGFPREGNGNPLHYSCQENTTDRRARRAAVHGVTKSWT